MFKTIKERFKRNPSLYYAMSIAATWAGVGSLMNGITVARENGIVPFVIWAIGNTLACIVFGIFAPMIPRLRDVFRSKLMHVLVGFLCVFQVWLSMNGIQSIFAETILGGTFGMAVAYAFALLFLILLFRFGMIRNVLTDNMSWSSVYAVAIVLTIAAIAHSRGNMVQLPMGLEPQSMAAGIEKAVLLLPGAFLYPYFFEILDYNEQNADGTKRVNIRMAFTVGGLLFGAYLVFTFLLAWTNFSPVLNIVKAVLITLVAISTLSSFLYSVYLTFGRKVGLAINIASVALWQMLIPMGVMGVWMLMSRIRIYIVFAAILAAIVWHIADRRAVSQ